MGMSKTRDAIVDALNKAIEIFSDHNQGFDEVMTNGIRPIADAVGLDRVVFYTLAEKDGVKRFGQIYLWDKSKGGLMSLDDELRVLPNNPVIEKWISTTSQGGCIRLRERYYSKDEAVLLRTYGIRSLLMVPIFTHGEFWGIVIFQDHTNDRYFDRGCADLLYSAARVFTNAIIRAGMGHSAEDAIKALKRREKMLDTLNRAAVMFLSQNEKIFEETMTAGVKEIADVFNLDRLSIWRNLNKPDAMHVSQIYRWDREAGGTTEPTKGLEDVTYAQLAPRWEQLFASGESINGPVRLLPEAPMLKSFGCVSAFITPIYINNVVWGFALLEDRHNERFFEADSVEMMRSAILLCANTVIRADMEREITNANEFNRVILDASPLGFTVFDENARVIDCNDIVWKILRTTKKYYIEHFNEFSPEYQSDGVLSADKAVEIIKRAINGEKLVFEWAHRSSMGELIPIEVTTVRAMYNGRYVAMSYQYDMRNSKNMEKKLIEALHKATEASKAKSEFLSNMSHEMRTPLNAIIGMTTIGRKAKDMERKDYALDKIEVASTHLLGVINDVLDMSKIEANMLELSPIEFIFEKMLQKIVTVVNFRVEEKKQKLSIHIDKAIPRTMIADDQRLAQVITNLLINAVKFTPEKGSITLNACFIGEENGLCTIQISVTDTGIGISSEQQTHLFRSFQQAESSTTRKYGGSGLGLAISKKIVEMMDGKIWIESEIDKGSTFIFTVKMKRGTGKDQGVLIPGLNLKEVRVLAVDDDTDVLDNFREIMQGIGISCETAKNGEEALKLAEQKGAFHIYFVDLKMPDMDGIKLTHELKKKSAGNTIVIMMSAFEWTVIAEEAKKAGVDKFLSKPLFSSSIVDVINECLGVDRNKTEEAKADITGIFTGRRILLAEDVEINREIVQSLLEPTKLEIDCAENGIEAVRKFYEAPYVYDLIFMDVQMPEMDGYEATRRIRTIEAGLNKNNPDKKPGRIPIIAMTANVFHEDIKKCLDAGMDSHVGKPLDFDEVIKRLRSYW
jgi:signal transduction histidine kinase/CheY-like chemotaxis protein/PAS domain-containing protein